LEKIYQISKQLFKLIFFPGWEPLSIPEHSSTSGESRHSRG